MRQRSCCVFVPDVCSVDEYDIESFMPQLDEPHVFGFDDIAVSMVDDRGREEDHEGVIPMWKRLMSSWRHKLA